MFGREAFRRAWDESLWARLEGKLREAGGGGGGGKGEEGAVEQTDSGRRHLNHTRSTSLQTKEP